MFVLKTLEPLQSQALNSDRMKSMRIKNWLMQRVWMLDTIRYYENKACYQRRPGRTTVT